jgi:hypothetical protein
MDSITLLRQQFGMAHDVMESTIEGVTNEHAAWMPPGKAHSVGASYAHVVLSEDMLINGMFSGQTPMFATTWMGKTGISELMPMPGPDWETSYGGWTQRVKVDMAALRAYAKAVYAKTDEYLASLTPDDLDRTLDLSGVGMGQMNLAGALSMLALGHVNNLAGEISAIKGTQGLKGYPF